MSVKQGEYDVSATASYPATPQFEATFEPRSIAIINMDEDDAVFVSFDGTTDHAHLAAGATISFEHQQEKQIWLKRDGAGSAPTNVQIIAER